MLRQQNKPKLKLNKSVAVLIILSVVFIFIFSINIFFTENKMQVDERNYKAEVLMNISPNMESRTPTEKDIDTQLNLQTSDGSIYRLFESRDMISYGKTFVVRIR